MENNENVNAKQIVELLNKMNVGDPVIVVNLETARNKSVGVLAILRNTIVERVDINKLKKAIAGVVASAFILVSGVVLVNEFNDPTNMNNLSREIGGLVREYKDGETKISIVAQNTYRNEDVAYYNQEQIAIDLLKLDKDIFDYGFCSVCVDMGDNINNKVGVDGKSNIDSVIYYLKKYSGEDSEKFNSYVSEKFKDVNTLNEFLIKNGYLDKDGGPSLDAYIESCEKNAQNVFEIIESQDKGAKLS